MHPVAAIISDFLAQALKTVFRFLVLVFFMIFAMVEYVLKLCVRCEPINSRDQVLIVGCCGTLGSEVTYRLAKSGCKFVLIDKNKSELENMIENIKANTNNEVIYLCEDVTNFNPIKSFLDDLIDRKIPPTVVIFCPAIESSGIASAIGARMFNHIMNVNVTSLVNMMNVLLPYMPTNTRIGVICSMLSFSSCMYSSAYCASKAALDSYTQSMQLEYPQYSFSTIYPCKIRGPLFKNFHYHDMVKCIVDEHDPKYVAENVIWMLENRVSSIYLPFFIVYIKWLPNQFKNFILSKIYHVD
ncbi:Dehydrogenase/reductase SDR family member 7 [Thelohanellus kitauei]|uniref:Dehydrogenase/reductase SDR family member 7 n=1 Tax=Thelohanellus kitauei TaxID=669202 RepID=A0A0C2J772_THEKT|nr:Dehydrogenase/reductase SDR family member 7 [Thelohanellus kitauei]